MTPFIEGLNGKLRDELLNGELFTSLREAEVRLKQFATNDNEFRPHSTFGYLKPKEFAARIEAPETASASPDGQGARPASGSNSDYLTQCRQWIDRPIQTFNPQPRPD